MQDKTGHFCGAYGKTTVTHLDETVEFTGRIIDEYLFLRKKIVDGKEEINLVPYYSLKIGENDLGDIKISAPISYVEELD